MAIIVAAICAAKKEKKNIPYTQLKLQDNWELS